jgi:hypothetical protein
MAQRRARRGGGTHPTVLRERTSRYGTPKIRKHLGDAAFAVVGGVATRLYMPERMTLDVDVLVPLDSVPHAERCLRASGCERIGTLTVGGSTWRLPDGSTLDLIAGREPWVPEALAKTVSGPGSLPYIALPFLVVMKLSSGRVQDLADITRMLGNANEAALNETRAAVAKFRPEDAQDLESMIRLGRLEYE